MAGGWEPEGGARGLMFWELEGAQGVELLGDELVEQGGVGLAFERRMTWPTKKAATVFLPPRYCSTCLGLAAMTSSIMASMAAASEICCGFSRS